MRSLFSPPCHPVPQVGCLTTSDIHVHLMLSHSPHLMERSAVASGSSRRDRVVQPVRSRLVHLVREGAAASRPGRGIQEYTSTQCT